MRKSELLEHGGVILRILEEKEERLFVVNCVHQSMPKWVEKETLHSYGACSEEELASRTGREIRDYDELDKESRRFAHEHFTLIAGILPFVSDERVRSSVLAAVAEEKGVSRQTIRHYLWLYLVYQEISALAPNEKKQDKPLTQDEKNMRWALNKFFYTRRKNSLNTAYTMMLKEKYCDPAGVLLPEHPSINQFRYFYRKHRKLQTYYISREGLKRYQRDHRPLLGDGVQEFAASIGVGMLDSTICDIYLVDDAGNLIGRPILTACVDAYSGMCCGYSLTWEGGVYSLRNLLVNVIADKVIWCRRFGITIQREDWDCSQLPATLVTDKGSEYVSANIEQLAELGVTIVNLPAYRPELKGRVEKFFDLVQSYYKNPLKGKGVIEPDFQERGAHDYRKDACLTMRDFETILLHCILYYNCHRVIKNFPFTKEMLEEQVKPYSHCIWNWGKRQTSANLIPVRYDELVITLLPRTTGKFSRMGLRVNGLRYRNAAFTEQYLQGRDAEVAYNPEDVSCVWLLEGGKAIEFLLSEGRYKDCSLKEAEELQEAQKICESTPNDDFLQSKIDLVRHIEAIADSVERVGDVNIKGIRDTRAAEQRKTHVDFVKGGGQNG